MANVPPTEEKTEAKVVDLPMRGSAPIERRDAHHFAMTAPLDFNDEVLKIIRDSMMAGASEVEFRAFIEVCKARRLNPLLKQIHPVKRKVQKEIDGVERWIEVWSYQTGIDGFRVIAQRTGEYDGQDEAEYELDKNGFPICARVKVYRKGISRPFVGVAYYSEYVQTKRDGSPVQMWKKMPRGQTAKCAEALAFRKAFPEDLSGLYTDDEMGGDDVVGPAAAAAVVASSTVHGLELQIDKAQTDAQCQGVGRNILACRSLNQIDARQEDDLRKKLTKRREEIAKGPQPGASPRASEPAATSDGGRPAPTPEVDAKAPTEPPPSDKSVGGRESRAEASGPVSPPGAPPERKSEPKPRSKKTAHGSVACGAALDGSDGGVVCTRPEGHDASHFDEVTGEEW